MRIVSPPKAEGHFAMKILIVLHGEWSSNMDNKQKNHIVLFSEVSTEDVMKKLEKRNNETTLSDARARYLQRKQQRQQSKAL